MKIAAGEHQHRRRPLFRVLRRVTTVAPEVRRGPASCGRDRDGRRVGQRRLGTVRELSRLHLHRRDGRCHLRHQSINGARSGRHRDRSTPTWRRWSTCWRRAPSSPPRWPGGGYGTSAGDLDGDPPRHRRLRGPALGRAERDARPDRAGAQDHRQGIDTGARSGMPLPRDRRRRCARGAAPDAAGGTTS